MTHRLEILAFRTRVHLGWTAGERAQPQEVDIDAVIEFDGAPAATRTDELEDTLCYDQLCSRIDETARAHPYKLIEALAREIHEALQRSVGDRAVGLEVSVHKLNTPIAALRGGARFTYRGESKPNPDPRNRA